MMKCSKCNSTNIEIVNNDKQNYSFTKGAIGTVLLGPIGAVAGVNKKNQLLIVCKDCGTVQYLKEAKPLSSKEAESLAKIEAKIKADSKAEKNMTPEQRKQLQQQRKEQLAREDTNGLIFLAIIIIIIAMYIIFH